MPPLLFGWCMFVITARMSAHPRGRLEVPRLQLSTYLLGAVVRRNVARQRKGFQAVRCRADVRGLPWKSWSLLWKGLNASPAAI